MNENAPTPEEFTRWTRQLAEIEGWTDIRPYDGEYLPYRCINYDLYSYDWGEGQSCPLIGKPPDEDSSNWHLPDYSHDLNDLYRACRKICETEKGREFLYHTIRSAWWDIDQNQSSGTYDWQACLTAEELFPIVGKTTDTLKESESAT